MLLTIKNREIVLLLLFGLSTIQVGLKAVNIPACFKDISGIFLRKFNDSNDYALNFFFPLGGALQLSSTEKLNAGQFFSDQSGFYECTKQLGKIVLSFHGVYFQESGNMSVGLTKAQAICQGASDDCSDREVQCSNGTVTTQFYKLEEPNPITGSYTNPISPITTRYFESQRLYTHPTVTSVADDQCYSEMSGVYVVQYSDGTYGLVALTALGYLFSVTSNERRKGGLHNRGTSVGM
ncbi:unnamed protein product, partial [Didymodactylos carnosus]